jgi:hypothetical protein
MALFFSRNTKVRVAYLQANGTEDADAVWEIPVLDGFSFSQSTNTSEVTLNEMSAGSSVSRRGRKMFTDSYAPAEWSFSTYARPFKTLGTGETDGRADDTVGFHHAVEECLWAMLATNAVYTHPDTSTNAAWTTVPTNAIVSDATDMDIKFTASNLTELAKANIYFINGTTVYKIANCAMNEASLDFDIDGITTINWSGMGSIISEEAPDLSTTPDATRFEGSTGTSNFIRNRLTELTAVSAAGFPSTGAVTYGLTLTGGNVTISNNISFVTPETIGIVNQPLEAVTGTRTIGGSFSCYLDSNNTPNKGSMDLFENIIEGTDVIVNQFDLNFKVGGASGTPRIELNMERCHLEVPTHSIDDIISLEVNFSALGTDITTTDELTVKYVGA